MKRAKNRFFYVSYHVRYSRDAVGFDYDFVEVKIELADNIAILLALTQAIRITHPSLNEATVVVFGWQEVGRFVTEKEKGQLNTLTHQLAIDANWMDVELS